MTFAAQPGAQLERWDLLIILLVAFAAIVVALAITGRRAKRDDDWLLWVPNGLERVTGIPGWAAGMIGTAAFGLLVAGIGFYNDVAWHVGRRDKELFTAPHSMIIIGLGLIALAAGVGILFATLQRVDTALRVKALRVPWSAVPLGLLGVCALSGFPLDDLWHATYGIDVTMWSPTHMLMICGAAFSLIAAWLALAEAGVSFRQNRWTKVVHFIAAWFVLAGLTAPLGEFRFGVPQFQQLFHPLLLLLAAAFAFVPTRIVLGRGWAIVLALATFLPESLGLMSSTASNGFVPTRTPGMFIASAIAVELAAVFFGTERRLRFAITSGIGVATIGLAGEWWWNRNATQPWNGALMRDALLLGLVIAIGAAILGAAYAGAVNREPGRLPRTAILLGTAAVLIAIVLPMPRRTSNVVAQIDMTRTGDTVALTVHLDPPDAAQNALVPGHRVAGRRTARRRSARRRARHLRVGRSAPRRRQVEVDAAPPHRRRDDVGADLPARRSGDRRPRSPATSRTIAFADEQQYLMREVKPGPNTVMVIAYVVVGLVVIAWAAAFVLACTRIPKRPPLRTPGTRSAGPDPDPSPAHAGDRQRELVTH